MQVPHATIAVPPIQYKTQPPCQSNHDNLSSVQHKVLSVVVQHNVSVSSNACRVRYGESGPAPDRQPNPNQPHNSPHFQTNERVTKLTITRRTIRTPCESGSVMGDGRSMEKPFPTTQFAVIRQVGHYVYHHCCCKWIMI